MADNTQNTGSSKKKKIVTAAIAVALAAALLIGGTFSYLTASSDEVENEFSANYNKVTLTETNGAEEGEEVDYDFEIVPGTSETKDPTVTATYTLDSYVFLLVDDDTADLVDYDILTTSNNGVWTLLYSEDAEDNPVDGYAVYYTTVTSSTADTTGTATDSEGNSYTYYTDTIKVIVGDEVYYPSTLTNDDMFDDDGNLIGGISLSFMAYIIQANPFNDLADDSNTDAKTALLAILGLYTQYDEDEDTTLTAVVATTIASDSTTDSTSTTFTLTIPTSTTIVGTATTTSTDDDGNTTTSTSTTTPTSLTLSVTETTADTVAVVPDGDAGDYTYEISLVDQDGNSVSATSGYMNVAIQIKTGITASNLTVTKLGDNDTTLSTTASTDVSDYYSYNSTTGILTIYTQSLGEYEISWNDTGISLTALSGDDLTFTNTMYSTLTVTALAGVKVNDSNQQESGGHSFTTQYDDWAIEVCMTTDTDLSKVVYATCYTSTNSSMQGQARNYINASYTANETVGIVAKSFGLGNLVYSQLDIIGTGGTTTNGHSTGNGNWKYYNVKTGFYSSTSMSGKSVTFELRLYEGTSNSTSTYTTTGNYIILDTLTVEIS